MRVRTTLLMLAASSWPVVAAAQSRPTAYTAWADFSSRARIERNGCRAVVLTQAPAGIAGLLMAGRHNPARDPNSQTDKMTEFRYVLGGSLIGSAGFMAGGSAVCWAAKTVQLRHARERGLARGYDAPTLDASRWHAIQAQAERHVRVGRRATFAGAALLALGTLTAANHRVTDTERGLDRIGTAPIWLIGGALSASLGGAVWADGVSRLRTLTAVPPRSAPLWAVGPRGRRGVQAQVVFKF